LSWVLSVWADVSQDCHVILTPATDLDERSIMGSGSAAPLVSSAVAF
jgi:hypothetical protein